MNRSLDLQPLRQCVNTQPRSLEFKEVVSNTTRSIVE